MQVGRCFRPARAAYRSLAPFAAPMLTARAHGGTNARLFATATAVAPQQETATTSRIAELSHIIAAETKKVEDYLASTNHPALSFAEDAPADLQAPRDADVQTARRNVVNATQELHDLMVGPREKLRWMAWDYNDNFSLQAIVEFKIAHAVPINGTATYHDIASAVKLPEVKVRQLVRHAMTNRIFYEPSPGVVAHTAASRTLRNEEVLSTWISLCSGEFFPAATHGVDALQKLPDSQEPSEAGWAFGHNCVGTPMFKVAMSDPARAKRFGVGMASLAGGPGYELAYTAQCYDWAALGEATVVDLGGSHGFLSVDLAKRFPDLKFVVQDLPKAIDSVNPESIPTDVRDRVDFMAHDFYTPQPVKDADAYVYRWIMHNNSDKYAVKMLRALIPALKPGARVIINDLCLFPPGHEDDWDNRITRNMDITMLKLLNAREREDHDWQDLFQQADARFKYKGHKTLPGYRMAVMEAVWEP